MNTINKYPTSGFYFNVKFNPSINDAISGFSEVSGLEVKINSINVKLGEDHSNHQLPQGHPVYKNLVLKRGFLMHSAFTNWGEDTFKNFNIKLKDLDIELSSVEEPDVIKAA